MKNNDLTSETVRQFAAKGLFCLSFFASAGWPARSPSRRGSSRAGGTSQQAAADVLFGRASPIALPMA